MNITLYEDEIVKAIECYLAFKGRAVRGQWSAQMNPDNTMSMTFSTVPVAENLAESAIIEYLKSSEMPNLNK